MPLRAQIAGPARVQGDLTEEVRGSSDLLAFVTPSRISAIAPRAAVRVSDQFMGSKETYLGLPLLLVVAVVTARRRGPVVRIDFAMLVACMVLSLGSRLRAGGLAASLPLPWSAVEALPVLWHMVPARLALLTGLFAGLLLAVAVEELWRGGGWRRWALAVAAPRWCSPSWPRRRPCRPHRWWPRRHSSPARRCPGPARRRRPGGPVPPEGPRRPGEVWQAEAGMRFKMPGGYFVGPDPNGGTLREAPATVTSRALDRIHREERLPT